MQYISTLLSRPQRNFLLLQMETNRGDLQPDIMLSLRGLRTPTAKQNVTIKFLP